MRKILLFFGFGILFVGLSYFWMRRDASSRNASSLVIGTAAGYAPFVSLNEKNEYEGFDIDVAHALAKKMGMQLQVRDLGSMSSLFIALDQGKIDAIIWGLSIIPDRIKKVAMVPYYGDKITAYQLLFWNNIPEGVTSIDDLKGKIVCVEVGSTQERMLSRYPGIIKKPMNNVIDSLMEIQYGKADATFVEPAVAKKFKEKFPEIKVLDVPLEKDDQELGVGIAIKKDRKDLIQKMEKAVHSLKQSGMLDALERKWGL